MYGDGIPRCFARPVTNFRDGEWVAAGWDQRRINETHRLCCSLQFLSQSFWKPSSTYICLFLRVHKAMFSGCPAKQNTERNREILFLPQGTPVQLLLSSPSPSQGLPPYAGAGVSQYLSRVLEPLGPQLALQLDHWDQALHPPQIARQGKQKSSRNSKSYNQIWYLQHKWIDLKIKEEVRSQAALAEKFCWRDDWKWGGGFRWRSYGEGAEVRWRNGVSPGIPSNSRTDNISKEGMLTTRSSCAFLGLWAVAVAEVSTKGWSWVGTGPGPWCRSIVSACDAAVRPIAPRRPSTADCWKI